MKIEVLKGNWVGWKMLATVRVERCRAELDRLEAALAKGGGPLPGILENRIAAKRDELNAAVELGRSMGAVL